MADKKPGGPKAFKQQEQPPTHRTRIDVTVHYIQQSAPATAAVGAAAGSGSNFNNFRAPVEYQDAIHTDVKDGLLSICFSPEDVICIPLQNIWHFTLKITEVPIIEVAPAGAFDTGQ